MNGDGWGCTGVSVGDRIEAPFSEWMTAGDPAQSHPRAANGAKTNERYVGVLRAGRQIEALRWAEGVQYRRENRLIDTKGDTGGERGLGVGHDAGGGAFCCLSCCFSCCFSAAFWIIRKTWATSRSSTVKSRSMTLRRGCSTTSTGRLREVMFLRTASRMRRLMRLRSTALPITLPTVRPMRGVESSVPRRGVPSGPSCGRRVKK